jgi:hypothetical protein
MMVVHWYPNFGRGWNVLSTIIIQSRWKMASVHNRTDLQEDHRRSVLWHTATPVFQGGLELPPLVWWNNFNAWRR